MNATGVAEIRRLVEDLPIEAKDYIVGRSELLYRLASTNQFTQGRDTKAVAAVCLYYCCREGGYARFPVMLMDLAAKLQINVYRLGDTYKEFQKKLYLKPDVGVEAGKVDNKIAPIGRLEIEAMVERFCKRLEFGDDYRRVASDAVALVARMDRDWMVTGRRPAGLCGACIILAARMHNYRRSVREVVYVVRVADTTIIQRLEEFRRTTASRMTVKQFREGGKHHRYEHDPPAIRKRKEKEQKREQRLKLRAAERATEGPDVVFSRQTSAVPDAAPSQEPRRDAEGFLIPPLPIDPSLTRESTAATAEPNVMPAPDGQPKKRGRKRKRAESEQPPFVLHEADIITERALEKEIEKILHDHIESDEFSFEQARRRAEAQAEAERIKWRQAQVAAGRPHYVTPGEINYDSELIDPSEFADDPEVAGCELSEAERAVKEKIWLTRNEDWLRQQQKRMLDRTLEEARTGGVKKSTGRKGNGKRLGRPGDLTYQEGMPRAATPAESMQRMIGRRGKPAFSRNVNYEELGRLYQRPSSTSSEDGRSTRTGSVASDTSESPPSTSPPSTSPPALQKPSQQSSSRRPLPTPASDRAKSSRPIFISDDDEESDEEEQDTGDDEIRQALRSAVGPAAALGFGEPHANETDMEMVAEADFDKEKQNQEEEEQEQEDAEEDDAEEDDYDEDEPEYEEMDERGEYDETQEEF